MSIQLKPHQKEAIKQLETGKILCGGVGTGKSLTSIAYWWTVVCGGQLRVNGKGDWVKPERRVDLYILTTAKKRNELDWEGELVKLGLSKGSEGVLDGLTVVVDSWNNIRKYEGVRGAFFILDEQRLVGSGAWVKSFYKIAQKNDWILLSATPGDTWMDYIPVFVANGFYKNKSEFVERHCIYNRFSKYPKVDRFVATKRLYRLRDMLLVDMPYERTTTRNKQRIFVEFDRNLYRQILKTRQDPVTGEPFKNSSALMAAIRRANNSHTSRLEETRKILANHPRVIIFYNYDFELEILRTLKDSHEVYEFNGHKHDPVPTTESWVYLVQYKAGSEGWNCTSTDTMIMYSLNYAHRMMEQAYGRIDRLNTPYSILNYYLLMASSSLDLGIWEAIQRKRTFSESAFLARL